MVPVLSFLFLFLAAVPDEAMQEEARVESKKVQPLIRREVAQVVDGTGEVVLDIEVNARSIQEAGLSRRETVFRLSTGERYVLKESRHDGQYRGDWEFPGGATFTVTDLAAVSKTRQSSRVEVRFKGEVLSLTFSGDNSLSSQLKSRDAAASLASLPESGWPLAAALENALPYLFDAGLFGGYAAIVPTLYIKREVPGLEHKKGWELKKLYSRYRRPNESEAQEMLKWLQPAEGDAPRVRSDRTP